MSGVEVGVGLLRVWGDEMRREEKAGLSQGLDWRDESDGSGGVGGSG